MRRSTGFVLFLAVAVGAGAIAYQRGWVAAGLSAVKGEAKAEVRAAPVRAVPVEVALVRRADVTSDISSIGSLQSDESVKVASEVAGRIHEIRFQEGQQVKAGDVLVQLDDALVKASQAEMEARLGLAKANYERAQQLSKTGSGTTRSLDEAFAELNTSTALLNLQQVQLAKHSIRAPFDGVVGLRSISNGAYIDTGDPLVNLEKLDTLKVDFKVPEIQLGNIRPGQSVGVLIDAIPNRTFTGTIYAIDPMVDVNGRSLSVRARLPNQDMTLRPGLFVRVVVKGRDTRSALFVPESSIVPRGQERIVWVIENGKAVEAKVKLGQRLAGEVEIISGLKSDAQVVTAGQNRLRQGAVVEIVGTPPAPQS